ncbi:MAG: hypothetical protein QW727_02120 [Candidatus Pacearchaeota archaeon]
MFRKKSEKKSENASFNAMIYGHNEWKWYWGMTNLNVPIKISYIDDRKNKYFLYEKINGVFSMSRIENFAIVEDLSLIEYVIIMDRIYKYGHITAPAFIFLRDERFFVHENISIEKNRKIILELIVDSKEFFNNGFLNIIFDRILSESRK